MGVFRDLAREGSAQWPQDTLTYHAHESAAEPSLFPPCALPVDNVTEASATKNFSLPCGTRNITGWAYKIHATVTLSKMK